MKRIILGITGTKAAGKGEVIKILQKIGYKKVSLSDIVREEAEKKGIDLSTFNLQNIGNNLRSKKGGDVLAKRIVKLIDKVYSHSNLIVIDSIRNPAEISYLSKHYKKYFHLIGVDADKKIRLKRYLKREKATKKDFEKDDKRDRGIGESKNGQQVEKCLKLAENIIINNDKIAKLTKSIIALHIKY